MSGQPRPRLRLALRIASVLVVLIILWIGYDLFAPRISHLKDFDPEEVARLETAMWRSYYDKQQVTLFNQLSEMLRTQYNMPFFRSNVVAYYAANAAFVFKRGKQRSDYEMALPNLVKFYQSIRDISDLPFDANRAAKLELEWWIIHRDRAKHPPQDLERSLADLQSEIYHVPSERVMEHGRLRAEAMTIRDNQAEGGGVQRRRLGQDRCVAASILALFTYRRESINVNYAAS